MLSIIFRFGKPPSTRADQTAVHRL